MIYERYCPRCGVPANPDEETCKKCGKQLLKKPKERKNIYCKYCGKELHQKAIFCSRCGKKIHDNHKGSKAMPKSIKSQKWVLPIALLLFFLFSNITGETISWVFAGLGLVVVLVLWLTKCIKPEKIEPSAICIPIAVLLLEGMRNLGFWVIQNFSEPFMGQYGVIASSFASSVFPTIESTYGANTLWLWGLFIWFLLLRCDAVRHRKIHYLIVGISLVIWSFALTFIMPGSKLAMEQGMPAAVIQYIDGAHKHYFLWMFLRRLVMYCLICFAGTKRMGTVGTLIFPTVIIVGSIILIPICFAKLTLGMVSVSVLSFGYLFGVIVLLVALIKGKKKMKKEDKEYVLPKLR